MGSPLPTRGRGHSYLCSGGLGSLEPLPTHLFLVCRRRDSLPTPREGPLGSSPSDDILAFDRTVQMSRSLCSSRAGGTVTSAGSYARSGEASEWRRSDCPCGRTRHCSGGHPCMPTAVIPGVRTRTGWLGRLTRGASKKELYARPGPMQGPRDDFSRGPTRTARNGAFRPVRPDRPTRRE